MQRLVTAIVAGFALLFPGAIHAGGFGTAGTPLQVTLMREEAEFEVPFYDAFITVGENKFTFVVPQGFRLKGDPALGRLTLGTLDGDRFISFTILNSGPTDSSQINMEACRALVLKQHPGGKILKELSAGVCGRPGRGLDIQWKATEELYQYERIVFVPTAFGLFEFTATSGRNAFPQSQAGLGLVMATFRASTDGKFRPVHMEDVN